MAPLEPTFQAAVGPDVGAYDARGEVIEFFGSRRRRCSGGWRPLAGFAPLIWAAWLACSRQLRIAVLAVAGVVTAVRVAAGYSWRRAFGAVARAVSPPARPVCAPRHGLARMRPRAAGWQVVLLFLLCTVSGASADVRGHLWGEPSRAYFAALEHVEYPTPRPGRPLYDRAELLQELHSSARVITLMRCTWCRSTTWRSTGR